MLAIALAIAWSLQENLLSNISQGRETAGAVRMQPNPLTQDDAVRIAIASNPNLRALAFDLESAAGGVASARAPANPQITLTSAITPGGADEELLVAQPLEINGLRSARAGVAGARRRLAEAEARTLMRETLRAVKMAYVSMARAKERLQLARHLAEYAEEIDRIAQRQVELGSRPGIDRTQTGVQLVRANQQLTLSQAEHDSARFALNALLGREPSQALEVTGLSPTHVRETGRENSSGSAVGTRSEVQAAEARRDLYRQESRLVRSEGLPDLAPHYRIGGITKGPRQAGFGVGISIPLLDYGSRRNRMAQLGKAAMAEEKRLEATRIRVQQETAQAFAELHAATQVIEAFQGGMLEDARKIMDSARAGFRLGETSLVAVLEAQRTFRGVQAEYIEAIASHEEAVASIEFASGWLPPEALEHMRTREVNIR